MSRLIDADEAIKRLGDAHFKNYGNAIMVIRETPTVDVCPTLREKALLLLVEWAEECGFGYDNFPEDYETYKDEIEGMGYIDGMIYIAERVVENETD